ncbi:MAG: wax ester/triacylglycerol synthase family O-acyltransferase [Acidimicrobiia bacterium]|nr:wax ester/triacylglycerol synthase family O-acyltransferase [Acidimicrobiia bacterium]
MDRLSTLDAEFLHLEDDIAHMHIAGACVFADPPPSFDDVGRLVAAKLHLIPRYRQRVRAVPLELGRPVWVDDPHFDLGYHLRHVALPAPGDDAAFCRLMGRLMSEPLDRQRPLWETWLVEGLEGGHWALVFKIHHCMVDGIAGVELLGVLLDAAPDTTMMVPEPWEPRPEPLGAAKVLDAWGGLVTDAVATVRDLIRAVGHPTGAIRSAFAAAQGLARFASGLGATPPLSIEGTIGPHRAWAHSSASLADVRTIRAGFGGTINDVVLAAVSGGYRELLISRGEDADGAEVRSMVPVSTRHDDGRGVADNRVSTLLYDLPIRVADPVERLGLVHEQMTELKASHMAEAGEAMTAIGNLAPPMVVGALSRLAIRAMHQLPQRSVNTITTNVPGPQFPLYCIGREMLEYRPFVPISHGVRVTTAILSYNGRLYFGITGDYKTAPDVDVLASGAARGIEQLCQRALAQLATTPPEATRSDNRA